MPIAALLPYHAHSNSLHNVPVAALSELSDVSTASASTDVVPPKFTQLLKDMEGPEGCKIRFDCRVIGHPTPQIKWYKGRQKIESSTDFQVRGTQHRQRAYSAQHSGS
jgi:hypothetical protein